MMMHLDKRRLNKYSVIEIIFFLAFFFLFPILSDVEYRINENPCENCGEEFGITIVRRLVLGLFNCIPFWLLYKFILHGLLLRKKYLKFLLALTTYFFLLNFYMEFIMYGAIGRMKFLPGSISSEVSRWASSKSFFHFSVVYVVNQILVLTALAFFISYTRQEEKINKLKQSKLEADLKYLRTQIQPHFFFNTLNNIYSLAQQYSDLTAPLVARLAEMMRYIIYEASQDKAELDKEVSFLKNYVEVEKVRYGRHVDISFKADYDDGQVTVPPLLLLPFAENAFKHGVANETSAGFVYIYLCVKGKQLTLQVKNSKPSIPVNDPVTTGTGLANVQQRLDLLYPNQYKLIITDTKEYYETSLSIFL